MDGIKVSVIIPIYNTERFLDRCLQSIQNQTLTDLEIICINNGSTDNSLNIVKKHANVDSRIIVVDHVKSSIGTARNIGINMARGDFIGFVDSDDFINTHMFEKLYNKAQMYGADIAITNFYLYYEETEQVQVYRDINKFHFFENLGSFNPANFPAIVENVGIWDKLYRNDFLKKYNLNNPENLVFEDHLFSYQALALAEKVTVINQPLYYYRKSLPNSITGRETSNDKYKFDYLTINEQIKAFLTKENLYPIYSHEYIKYTIVNAMWHQGNICSYKNFCIFFKRLKSILSDDDLINVADLKNKKEFLYIKCLTKNLCFPYYIICMSKQMIKHMFLYITIFTRRDK